MGIEVIYKLRQELEDKDSAQSGGLRAYIEAQGFAAFTRLNEVNEYQQVVPRVEVKVEIGAATGHRFVCPDGVLRYDMYNFRLGAQVVTSPSNVTANNQLHEVYAGQVASALSSVGAQSNFDDLNNFPNVFIAEVLKPSGDADNVKDEDGFEYTVLGFEGIVCIRQSAWNNN